MPFWKSKTSNSNEEIKINWDDLQTDFSNLDLIEIYSGWPGIENFKKIKPLFLSSFGELFFVGDNNIVYQTDVVSLTLNNLNIKEEEFFDFINAKENVQNILLSNLVFEIKVNKLKRKQSQVFAYTPHPILGAKLNKDNIMVLDLKVWIHICKQLIEQEKMA